MFHNTFKFAEKKQTDAHMLMFSIKCFSHCQSYMNFTIYNTRENIIPSWFCENRKIGIIDTIAMSIILDGTSFSLNKCTEIYM